MIDYRQISPEQLEPHEEQQLLTECSEDPFGMQLKDLLDDVRKGRTLMFRWTGDFTGLMLVLIQAHPGGREMSIWHLSGTGFLEHIKEVRRQTKRLAREQGCRWVSAEARSMALARVYSKLSKMTAVKFLMEA